MLDSLPLFLAIAVWVFVWPPTILSQERDLARVPMRTASHSPDKIDV